MAETSGQASEGALKAAAAAGFACWDRRATALDVASPQACPISQIGQGTRATAAVARQEPGERDRAAVHDKTASEKTAAYQRMAEYQKTAEYVRRLCEGADSDGAAAGGPLAPRPTDQNKAPAFGGSGALSGGVARCSSRSALSRQASSGKAQANGAKTQANGAKTQAGGHDACDACGQPGQFICCEQCPRVFHFMCVEPPMTPEAVDQIDHWFCRECTHQRSRKRKSRAHAKNIFYPLISRMEHSNPRTFAVPAEIRRLFDGVEADVDGTYINVREDRAQRANLGPANRDFGRLADDHGTTILCYRCGLSALHGPVVRCDYCPLSWHWDCLDPPLSSAPPPRRRWMCPNHADHATSRRHRFRKERIVDHTSAPEGTPNSGLVDIVDDDPPWHEICDPKIRYRTTSTRIRDEFARNAAPCRVRPAGSEPPGGEPKPPPPARVSAPVAEWLQSIAAFQKDVARLAAGLPAPPPPRPVARCACGGAGRAPDGVAVLSSVAARLLAVPSAEPKPAPAKSGLATPAEQNAPPGAGSGDTRQARARRRQSRWLLAENGLGRSDLEEAVARIADPEAHVPAEGAGELPVAAVCAARPLKRRQSQTPPPRPCAAESSGPSLKRARSSSSAADLAPGADAAPAAATEARARAARAATLLASLLKAKGPRALVDFLLAE
ncbi:hypothetical protein H4R18_005016 [Coemansia javaensis]|uniref:PHD-type domain-containing protein n=1 Tax=Coemansia javaensis TaxID=2761396 RepID=A0A9W8LG84_9FUNG|nr:hypothetical protein H4R18_005016 [Coemansia javaensis]